MGNERYNAPAANLEDLPISLQYISSSKYEGDWPSAPHSHHCTELFYVTAGTGHFRIQEKSFPVVPNDMVIVNPHVLHTETATADSPMEYIVLGLDGADFLASSEEDSRYCFFHCDTITGNKILYYMKEILTEVKNNQAYSENISIGWLYILVSNLQRYKELSISDKNNLKTSLESVQIKRYIDNHFKEDISLDTLAKVAHLNKYYLSHTFKKDMGVSPINYLIQRRLKESKFLLEDTDHSIVQIAQFLGFSSPSYFSQCFSRVEGTSPREYRRKIRLSRTNDNVAHTE